MDSNRRQYLERLLWRYILFFLADRDNIVASCMREADIIPKVKDEYALEQMGFEDDEARQAFGVYLAESLRIDVPNIVMLEIQTFGQLVEWIDIALEEEKRRKEEKKK
ncbi:hypothetical protein KKC88_06380 [Patescibacteria group bacterium]|nr:hypothetical protein [Patescibacteria group bacterium]MBU1673891.1 hypothetical protein [Patescibacteria group bacterium]MBU1963436.1 hypothetical protein [Patescibacteria group bacterium]